MLKARSAQVVNLQAPLTIYLSSGAWGLQMGKNGQSS